MNQTVMLANIGTGIRIILGLAAGGLVTAGTITNAQLDTAAGAIATLVLIAWGAWKNQAAHTNKVASVQKAVDSVTADPNNGPVVVAAAKAGKL